ncbi:MOSC N-terminal beta barrel domain-containing protein [Thermoascus aurantiacus ATCC 26904]
MDRFKLPSPTTSPSSIALLAVLALAPVVVTLFLPRLGVNLDNINITRSSLVRLIRKNREDDNDNDNKSKTTEVVSLRVYPIKSCRGFEVSRTTLRMHGLDLDRRWMFVDAETNGFLTIRQIPEMTLINTGLSPDGEFLEISIADAAKVVRIPAYPTPDWLAAHTTLERVRIWDIETDGYLYNDGPEVEVNEFFSAFLRRAVRLVYKGPTPRVLRGNADPRLLGRTQHTFFPDVLPLLIASEASLAELNARLERKGADPITVERFRPNIVVRGTQPWAEDRWKLPKSKKQPLDVDIVARCARCQVPNVDPATAHKHRHEPWDTLMSYRRVDAGIRFKPCFGMLGVPRAEGEIAVGMRMEVLDVTDQHWYIKGF